MILIEDILRQSLYVAGLHVFSYIKNENKLIPDYEIYQSKKKAEIGRSLMR
jgi:hypothetical protein